MSLCFCGVVKTTLRLQTNYNVLLVCLAGTDLLVGIVVQPSFIVAQVYIITGRSPKRKRSFLDPRYSYVIIFVSSHPHKCSAFCSDKTHLSVVIQPSLLHVA